MGRMQNFLWAFMKEYGGNRVIRLCISDNAMMNGYDHTQMQNNNEGEGAYTIFLGGKAGVDAGAPDLDVLQKSMCLHSMEFSRCEQAIQWQIPEVALAFVCFFQMQLYVLQCWSVHNDRRSAGEAR